MVKYLLLVIIFLGFIKCSIAQDKSRHVVKFGISPYTYYFSEKLGAFNFGYISLYPTFEYNYRFTKFDIFFKRGIARWSPKTIPEGKDTSFMYSRNLKYLTLGLQKEITISKKLNVDSGFGITYSYGYDDVLQVSRSEINFIEDKFNSFGIDAIFKIKYQYVQSLTIEPLLDLHIDNDSNLHSLTFIFLFGFEF